MGRLRDARGRFVSAGSTSKTLTSGRGTKVTDTDRGYRDLQRNLRRSAKGPNVTVGVQGSAADEQRGAFGSTNLEIAAVHEFGSRDGRVPQRSFIRSSVDRERALIRRLLQRAAVQAAASGSAVIGLGIVGERTVAEMVRTIDQSIGLQQLADVTIARKGSTQPLIDSGQLKQAISWEYHDE